jgi:hypothetical protein
MNAYEKARDANIQRNAARLRSLGIPTVPPIDHSARNTRAGGEFRAKAAKRRRAAGKDARPLQVRSSHDLLPATRLSRRREASCLVRAHGRARCGHGRQADREGGAYLRNSGRQHAASCLGAEVQLVYEGSSQTPSAAVSRLHHDATDCAHRMRLVLINFKMLTGVCISNAGG